jgi:hypothetical protein
VQEQNLIEKNVQLEDQIQVLMVGKDSMELSTEELQKKLELSEE